VLDPFLASVVAGVVGSWSAHDFAWWCRVCEPWPPERIACEQSSEIIFWIDLRGVPRSGTETLHRFHRDGRCELVATVDYDKDLDAEQRVKSLRRLRLSTRGAEVRDA
jgi:hypothetical protein